MRAASDQLDALAAQTGGSEAALACAVESVRDVVAGCPELLRRADALADAQVDRLRDEHGLYFALSDDGHWLLERSPRQHGRLWEVKTEGPRLAFWGTIDGEWSLRQDDRLYGLEGSPGRRLLVLEPTTGLIWTFDDVVAAEVTPVAVVLQGEKAVRKLERATLRVEATVPLPEPAAVLQSCLPSCKHVRFFRPSHGTALVGDALVSFAESKVLRSELHARGISDDESRLLACDDDRMAVIDTATGATIAEFPNDCYLQPPVLSPDGAMVFSARFDRARGVDVTVHDVATGTVVRHLTERAKPLTRVPMSIERGATTRLCFGWSNSHYANTKCPWVLSAGGRITRRPRRPQTSRVKGTELVRTTQEGGPLIIVSFTRSKSDDEQGEDLQLSVFDPDQGQLLQTIPLAAGPFSFDPRILDPSNRVIPKPSASFLSKDRILLVPEGCQLPIVAVDLTHETVSELDAEPVVLGRGLAVIGRTLVDHTNGQRFSLSVSSYVWDDATRLTLPCAADTE